MINESTIEFFADKALFEIEQETRARIVEIIVFAIAIIVSLIK
jgi:hypothetical protein